ncbi:MAG: ABC transporter substrate-binding protein [Coxiella-like endosymbiont]|uniref:ABC transporter substrate-binding protein n=1 Tax=Coxiella-like endosymbiont TaxID=1592897 RepID=UPI00215AAF51|nr:ABC transporter substrate-binding protein [Coxiella-like endosymbiont]UVE59524.1 ABC transporter substrate-binding protein [Coxiella-like endosymbiont]
MQLSKPFFKSIVFIILFFIRKVVLADNSPITLLHVVNKMIVYLKKHQIELKKELQLPSRTKYQELALTIGLYRVVGVVVDRLYCQSTNPLSQCKRFIRKFEKLLIANYSSIITSHDGDRVQLYIERQTIATNNSVIVRRNSQRIPISYSLNGDQWKIYDFGIEKGISLIQRATVLCMQTLPQGGVTALLKWLIAYKQRSK